MTTQNKLSTSQVKIIRQRIDLDENDDSRDEFVHAMTPLTKLRHLVAWELGDEGWADWFLSRARKCGYTVSDEGDE